MTLAGNIREWWKDLSVCRRQRHITLAAVSVTHQREAMALSVRTDLFYEIFINSEFRAYMLLWLLLMASLHDLKKSADSRVILSALKLSV